MAVAGAMLLAREVLKCISELPSPFHKFRLLVVLASACGMRAQGLEFESWFSQFIVKLLLPPFMSTC
jgi:hypothetical protein